MTWLLDTSVCVGILRGRAPRSDARVRATPREEVSICSVVLFELRTGALKSARPVEELAKVNRLIGELVSFPFDDECARVAAEMRKNLESEGRIIGPYDLLIGATALRHGLTVVTRNIDEFKRIPDLRVEDWEA